MPSPDQEPGLPIRSRQVRLYSSMVREPGAAKSANSPQRDLTANQIGV
jgi:hypothetical protein